MTCLAVPAMALRLWPYWQLIDTSLLSDDVNDGCYRHQTRAKFWVWSLVCSYASSGRGAAAKQHLRSSPEPPELAGFYVDSH